MALKFDEGRIKIICDWLIKNRPDSGCDFYKMWLSVEILREMIGNEWTNQAIFPNNYPTTSKAVQDAIAFLGTRDLGFQFQERVSKLAIRLFNIQDISGLQKVVDEIRSGDLYGGYAELEAGDFFIRRNMPFEFVIPTGKKGEDFDIKIINNPIINCEVKHKIKSTTPSKEVLEATLSHANKQIPGEEPALFFVKIPEEWIKNLEISSIVERTKRTFFPRNINVLGFILHWEQKVAQREGVFLWKFRYEKNDACAFDIKLVSEKLDIQVDPIDTLVRMMQKYIKKCQTYPYDY